MRYSLWTGDLGFAIYLWDCVRANAQFPTLDVFYPAHTGDPVIDTMDSKTMEIRIDDLRGPEVIQLLHTHLQSMASQSPPESVHALDLDGLRKPEVTFWSVWQNSELMGCGALKELDSPPWRNQVDAHGVVPPAQRVSRRASSATFSTRPGVVPMRGSAWKRARRRGSRRLDVSTPVSGSRRARHSRTTSKIRSASS